MCSLCLHVLSTSACALCVCTCSLCLMCSLLYACMPLSLLCLHVPLSLPGMLAMRALSLLSRLPSVVANWSAVCDYVLDAGLGAARPANAILALSVRCVLLLGLTLPSSVRVCLPGLSLALPLDLICRFRSCGWCTSIEGCAPSRDHSGELYRRSIRVFSPLSIRHRVLVCRVVM